MALSCSLLKTILAVSLLFCCNTSAQDTTTPAKPGCQNVTCSANEVCRLVEVQCIRAPCYPVPTCVSSTPVCDPDPCVGMACMYGRSKDENGCIRCGCYQPCYGVTCPDGHDCQATQDPATNTYFGSCLPTTTRPQCTPYKCPNNTYCRFGFKIDSDGCQMQCQCYDPCERLQCPDDKQCVMSADDCPKGEECRDSPMPYCADISDLSSTPSPLLSSTNTPVCGPEPCMGLVCMNGKARDSNGCILCYCYDPCDKYDCPQGQVCQTAQDNTTGTSIAKCVVPVTRPPCQPINCSSVKCSYGFLSDSNLCPTCECRDPCKGRQCPAGQHCVVSADDCPPGAECRDAPMPYCTDASTTTLAPTPQLSTTYARGERDDGQEALLHCCSNTGMSEYCVSVCSMNITLLSSNMETLSECFQYLGAFFHCASGGRSHSNCCSQRGISESCLYLCSGNDTLDLSNLHAVTQCVISSSPTVLSCFNEGLTDANTTMLTTTSTPSSTTADDVCSQDPVVGNCRANMERWYYSATHRACATFTYGGCGGNGNNFQTKDDCLARCSRSGNLCPDVQCNSSCRITVDEYGCHFCSCGDDCWTTGCPTGMQCGMIPGSCSPPGTNCPPVPACVPKPDVICSGMENCTLSCPRGFMKDNSSDCLICQCKTCPSACAGMVCMYGRVKGSDGCDTCACYDPCQSLSCPDQCRVMTNNATGDYYGECYSGPSTRAPPSDNRSPKPSLCLSAPDYGLSCLSADSVRWFYNQSGNACASFSFGGCLGNSNNFQTKEICEALCKDSTCPEMDCRSVQNCSYGLKTDDAGCPVCQCLDPCEGFECLGNTVCVSQKSDCAGAEACRDPFTRMCIDRGLLVSTTTTAAPSFCSPMVMCTMYCVDGFERDSNGCEICSCRDACKNCTASQTCVRMAVDCPMNGQRCPSSLLGYCLDKESTTSSPMPTSGLATSSPISPNSTPRRCLLCMMRCSYGMLKDADGCAVCHCYEPCQNVSCAANTICQVLESDCANDPNCPPNIRYQGRCVDKESTTSSPMPTSGLATSSPISPNSTPRRCLLCMMRCSYGMLKDADGCAVCHCYEPCQNVSCVANTICQVLESDCANDPNCPPNIRYQGRCVETTAQASTTTTTVSTVPSTTGCPHRPICPTICPYGNGKDSNGCYTCDCDDPCQRVTCDSTQVCNRETSPGYCEGDMCWISYTAVCKPKCTRQIYCNSMNCTYGLAKGEDGCEICQCFDPCQNVTCAVNEECTATMSVPPTGICTLSCPLMKNCSISCEFGYVKDSSGCNTCQCYDPCQSSTCELGQTCVPNTFPVYTGRIPERVYLSQCTSACQETMTCKLACRYGYAKNMTTECEMCQCYDPCQNVSCPSGQACKPIQQFNGRYQYVAQCSEGTTTTTTTATSVSTKPSTPGLSTTGFECGPVCRMNCKYGMVRDANGCQICKCINPCDGMSCRTSQSCVVSELGNGSHVAQCIECAMPMCMNPCFYGRKLDVYGCQSCDCQDDPCATVRCNGGMCQTLLYCPDNGCSKPSTVCVDQTRPCDGLQSEYQKTFANRVDMMPQLNCDSNGLFKPIQCTDYECWCVEQYGTPTSNKSSMPINCYSGNQTMVTLKIEADINVIKPGDGWQFKEQVSRQLSNRLGIDESLVAITKYVSGSIIANVTIGSYPNSDMVAVQDKLNLAKLAQFDVVYDNQTYQAILLGGPTTTSPLATPETTPPTGGRLSTPASTAGTGGRQGTPVATGTATSGSILMIVLVCVFVPIGFVAIAATVWFACKICHNERVIPPRPLSEKSGASTEIDSLESGSDKGYHNDDTSSTITKDEKPASVHDTTEA